VQIQTQRLLIRPVEAADWQHLQAIWRTFNASPFAGYDRPHDTEDEAVRARIARWAAAAHGTEHLFFAVCLSEVVIGYIAFNRREQGYEAGYCFHSAYHGRGYARESFAALLEYMRRMGAMRITAGTALANTPSVALLKSLGFAQVGVETVSFHADSQGNAIVFEGGLFELIF